MTRNTVQVVAAAGLLALFGGVSPAAAATAPPLGQTAPYAIVSSTYSNSNTGPQTIIIGNVCYTTPPATPPNSTSGATVVPCPPQVGLDQATALANLNSQSCVSIGAAVALNAISIGGGAPGVFPPGCYSTTGAMSITAGTSVTLSGNGVYIFRSGGGVTTGANSSIVLANGACASDVYWTPIAAATLGASSSFTGTIIAAAGISIGHFTSLVGRALAFGGTVLTDADTVEVPANCTALLGCVAGTTTPGLSAILNQTIPVSGSTTVSFTVSGGSIPNSLVVTATSSNGTLIPQSAMQISAPGPGGVRTLTVTGADGRSGVATIILTVTDPANTCSSTSSFQITVGPTAVPTMPLWGMLALSALLGLAGVASMRGRRSI